MKPPHRILVVEDDPEIASQLVRGLKREGFEVELRTHGHDAATTALQGNFDAMVLDLMLPGADGHEILRDVRTRSSMPVLILTARTDLEARVSSFALGAADYLPKPFFMEELTARLRARLGTPESERQLVQWQDITLDLDARQVLRGDQDLQLTAHEFNVLAYLATRPGRAVTRDQLVEAALSVEGNTSRRTVDSHITRIRRKLGPAGEAIHTVWRIGYRFDPPAEP